MSLSDRKITDGDISTKGVVAAPDTMRGTAQENKMVFDRLIREKIKSYLNGLIDDLEGASAAELLGFTATEDLDADNIQEAIEKLSERTEEAVDEARAYADIAHDSAMEAAEGAENAAQAATGAMTAEARATESAAEAAQYAADVHYPVSYGEPQTLTPIEQMRARDNIDAEKKGRVSAAADIIMRNGWNQILTGGNFMSDAGWNLNGCTLEIVGADLGMPSGKITALSTGARSIYRDIATKARHKYFVSYEAMYGDDIASIHTPKCGYGAGTTFHTDLWELTDRYKRYTDVFEAGEGNAVYIYFTATDPRPMHVRNAMLIDLTEMYGEGNEPTDNAFIDLFPAEYYPVSARTFGDLLWENATPNAAFSPQTISTGLTAYKHLMVIFTGYSGENKISVVTAKGVWTDATGTKNNRYIIKRAFTSSDTGVQFGKGFLNSTYGSAAEDNTVMIPYRIYGVR